MNPKFQTVIRTLLTALAVVTALALLAGCGDDDDADTAATGAKPTVADAWTRTTAEGAKTGAAYMKITGGSEDDRLLSASVPADVAGEVQVHEVVPADSGATGEMKDGDESKDEHGAMNDSESMDEHGAMDATESMGSGEMIMREVEAIEIPAGESVELKPGGYHVMLLDLKKPIAEGDSIAVTLTFEKAGEITVEAVAREATK